MSNANLDGGKTAFSDQREFATQTVGVPTIMQLLIAEQDIATTKKRS